MMETQAQQDHIGKKEISMEKLFHHLNNYSDNDIGRVSKR